MQKPITLVPVEPPPPERRIRRDADFAREGARRGRYHLPERLESASSVGFRVRLPLSRAEADRAAALLSLTPPAAFVPGDAPTEGELFEEAALGVLSSRQSTNFRGHEQVTLGPEDSAALATLLRALPGAGPVLDGAAYSHVGLSRPYRTPFTFLLTFVGHRPGASLWTVPKRAWDKRFHHGRGCPSTTPCARSARRRRAARSCASWRAARSCPRAAICSRASA